ncbi:MAG: NADPH-dependent F420 reductase [Bacteroidota bacterium]
MTIAIIGTGSVGSALGPAFARAGHTVAYGSREPARADVRALVAATGPGATASGPGDAVAGADVVVLATPWEATEAVVRALDLAGTTVLDTTNPIAWPHLRHSADPSGGELVQSWAPDAHVVKAFCTVGADVMADTDFPGGARPVLFVAGNAEAAKQTALDLAEAIGFEGIDAGGIERSRELEGLAILWIHHAMEVGREMAFGVLRR